MYARYPPYVRSLPPSPMPVIGLCLYANNLSSGQGCNYKYFADCIPNSKKRDNPIDGHPYPYYRPTLDRVLGWDPRLTIGHRRRQWMEPTIDLSLRSALPILSYTAPPSSLRGVSLKQNLNNMDLLRLISQKKGRGGYRYHRAKTIEGIVVT